MTTMRPCGFQCVFTAMLEADLTSSRLATGGGCIYSRIGATEDWLEGQRELTRENVRTNTRRDKE